MRPARPARPRRPRLRAGAPRARGALPVAHARRVARRARGARTPAWVPCSRSPRRPRSFERGRRTHVRARRDPRRRASRAAGRLRTRVEPGRGSHRLRDEGRPLDGRRRRHTRRADRRGRRPARVVAERPAARVRPRRLGVHGQGRRRRRAEARARRAPRLVAKRRSGSRSTATTTIVTLLWDGGGARDGRHGSGPGVRARRQAGRGARRRDRRRRPVRRRRRGAGVVGRRQAVAYVRDDTIYVDGKARPPRRATGMATGNACAGTAARLRPAASHRPAIAGGPGRWLLGFTSLSTTSGSARASSRAFARPARSG